jgi:hypothetical protein
VKLSTITLRVHEALHSGRRKIALKRGGEEWNIKPHRDFGVPCLWYVAPSTTEYEWIVQDNKPRFGDDRIMAKTVCYGHQITRVRLNGKMLRAGVIDGVFVDDLVEHCIQLARQTLNRTT